jgi:hypothetical protein
MVQIYYFMYNLHYFEIYWKIREEKIATLFPFVKGLQSLITNCFTFWGSASFSVEHRRSYKSAFLLRRLSPSRRGRKKAVAFKESIRQTQTMISAKVPPIAGAGRMCHR